MHARGNTLTLGTDTASGEPLVLPSRLRDKHLYIAGATGTGKSKLLETLIQQDIVANRETGCGVLVIDPHGSLYDNLLAWMTFTNLHRPVILMDMREAEWVVTYNVLRQRKANPAVVVENFVQAMAHVWGKSDTDETPLFARWAGNTLRALYERGCTLSDAIHLLSDRVDVRAALTAKLAEPIARRDWEMANSLKPKEFEDQVASTLNRLRRFLCNDVLRCAFGQPTASLDLGTAIDEGAIILVSLAREQGRVSKEDAELFATLLLTDLWTAAQERGKRSGVKPFYLYIDEFQRFVTPTIAENLDEARGFGLHLTLAHQHPKQLLNAGEHGKRIYDSVMENASSKVVFRLTDPENLEPLAKWLYMGVMDPDEVKHITSSTKVMAYREETRVHRSRSRTDASAYAEHESVSSGTSKSSSDSFDGDDEERGRVEAQSANESHTAGRTHSRQTAQTEGESESSMLIPIMGKEESSRQFRPLEEQVHRAMRTIFGQGERECVVRLAGMKKPASIRTSTVDETHVYTWRIKEYVQAQMRELPFVLPAAEAMKRLRERETTFMDTLAEQTILIEPKTSRRRKA